MELEMDERNEMKIASITPSPPVASLATSEAHIPAPRDKGKWVASPSFMNTPIGELTDREFLWFFKARLADMTPKQFIE